MDNDSNNHEAPVSAPATPEPAQNPWAFDLSHVQSEAVHVDAPHMTAQEHHQEDYNLQAHFHDFFMNGNSGSSSDNAANLNTMTFDHQSEHHQNLQFYEAPQHAEHPSAPAFETTHHPAFDPPAFDTSHSGSAHDSVSHDHGASHGTHDHSSGHDSSVGI